MLIVLSLILIVIGIYILCIEIPYEKANKNKFWKMLYVLERDDIYEIIGGLISITAGIALGVMLVLLPICHIGNGAEIAENQERYRALIYKVESGACRDEFGLLNKEILDDIQDWNEYIVHRKSLQKDFWVGVFYPNIYDQFETIDYEKYGRE